MGCSPWGPEELDTTSDFTFTFYFSALEKEMATHSSVLAWRIAGTEEPGRLLSMGTHRVRHDWSDAATAAAVMMLEVQHLNALGKGQGGSWSNIFTGSVLLVNTGLISFRIDWFDPLAVQGILKNLLQHHSSKASILRHSTFFMVQISQPNMTTEKPLGWLYGSLSEKWYLYF